LHTLRAGGRAAFPNGIDPVPQERQGTTLVGYNGEPDADIIRRLHALMTPQPMRVHVARVFPLGEAGAAHRALDEHYLGKLVLRIS